jgi:hypothetical protein
MLDKENRKLSWSMPQINEINVKNTEKGTGPYSDGKGLGNGPDNNNAGGTS